MNRRQKKKAATRCKQCGSQNTVALRLIVIGQKWPFCTAVMYCWTCTPIPHAQRRQAEDEFRAMIEGPPGFISFLEKYVDEKLAKGKEDAVSLETTGV